MLMLHMFIPSKLGTTDPVSNVVRGAISVPTMNPPMMAMKIKIQTAAQYQ